MNLLFVLFLLFAAPAPSSLEEVKADPNPDHRAKAGIDYAFVAEKNAEGAYAKGEFPSVETELKKVEESLELAQEALVASGKTPGRNPGPYKYAELRSRELLTRLGDLEQKMDISERSYIDVVKTKVQELHDAWFEGIMGRKR
jgi:hypothetical protein